MQPVVAQPQDPVPFDVGKPGQVLDGLQFAVVGQAGFGVAGFPVDGNAVVSEGDVRDVGVDLRHVADRAGVGQWASGLPTGVVFTAGGRLMALQAPVSSECRLGQGVTGVMRVVRVVAGHARKPLVLLVAATGPQLVDMADDGHLGTRTGQSELDALV